VAATAVVRTPVPRGAQLPAEPAQDLSKLAHIVTFRPKKELGDHRSGVPAPRNQESPI